MFKLFYIWIFLFSQLLFSHTYDTGNIRGNSWFTDDNQTLFLGQWRTGQIAPVSMGIHQNVITNGPMNRHDIALTFDDTPNAEIAGKLLRILNAYDVKGAFFINGSTLTHDNIDAVRRISQQGHLVLSHSYNHLNLKELSDTEIDSQLLSNAKRIEEITGEYPVLFRPPYGLTDSNVVERVNANKMTMVLWSIDSLDWTFKDPAPIIQIITGNIHNGDIILMHCNTVTADALPKIIEKLHQQGYNFERLDKLLDIKAYR